eukprot:Rhum_TRINITY_DN11568_c0_g1::Rhum_TRINITY_DN11568_c0_g1_i1::g.45378::m.45378
MLPRVPVTPSRRHTPADHPQVRRRGVRMLRRRRRRPRTGLRRRRRRPWWRRRQRRRRRLARLPAKVLAEGVRLHDLPPPACRAASRAHALCLPLEAAAAGEARPRRRRRQRRLRRTKRGVEVTLPVLHLPRVSARHPAAAASTTTTARRGGGCEARRRRPGGRRRLPRRRGARGGDDDGVASGGGERAVREDGALDLVQEGQQLVLLLLRQPRGPCGRLASAVRLRRRRRRRCTVDEAVLEPLDLAALLLHRLEELRRLAVLVLAVALGQRRQLPHEVLRQVLLQTLHETRQLLAEGPRHLARQAGHLRRRRARDRRRLRILVAERRWRRRRRRRCRLRPRTGASQLAAVVLDLALQGVHGATQRPWTGRGRGGHELRHALHPGGVGVVDHRRRTTGPPPLPFSLAGFARGAMKYRYCSF